VKELNPCCLPMFKKYRTSKLLNLRKKYRSDFEIIALILEAIKDGAPLFSIMKYTNMNSAQLKKYLGSLIETGFIEMDKKGGRVLYMSSEKGLGFLRHYYVLLGMILSANVQDTSNGPRHSATQIVTHLQSTP
jgi:predicted transcriptional regulator